ncbi:MAG: hypothetical protein WKF57_11970 [Nakamurella sp.]
MLVDDATDEAARDVLAAPVAVSDPHPDRVIAARRAAAVSERRRRRVGTEEGDNGMSAPVGRLVSKDGKRGASIGTRSDPVLDANKTDHSLMRIVIDTRGVG